MNSLLFVYILYTSGMVNFTCYHNGKFKKESEVCISFHDLGFQRAYGVFDYLRTYNHIPFQKEWHAKKLIQSIQSMNLKVDFLVDDFIHIMDELLVKNKKNLDLNKEYGIKTIITGGVNKNPTILMYIEEFTEDYEYYRKNGVALLTVESPRQSAHSKNIDYKSLFKAEKELKEKGCLEILHRDHHYVYESGTSNIFIVKNKKIITPKDGIYSGSTRSVVLDILNNEHIHYEERPVSWEEFIQADGVFLTASKKEILPVVKIYNNDEIIEFPIGDITKKLIALFKKNTTMDI